MTRLTPTVLLMAMVFVWPGCSRDAAESEAQRDGASGPATHEAAEPRLDGTTLTLAPEALEGQAFQTAVVGRRAISPTIRVTASISPNQYKLAHVSPRVEGKALEIMAELGDHVTADQTLAILDSVELGERKAAYLQARTNLLVTKRNYDRERRLYKQRISSEKDYLDARGAYERSVASYQATREALRMIGVPEHEIRTMQWGGQDHPLSHVHLTAPFGGTVVERHIRLGELIPPTDRPFTVADLSTVWVLLDVFETDLAHVTVGATVWITVEAYPDESFDGTVTYLSNLLDPDTRTAQARVEIPNPDGRLRPGMFATAALTMPSKAERVVVVAPETAIQRIDGQAVAFVEVEPGHYVAREVTLGATVPPDVEIESGLQERESVVTQGSFYLKSALLAERMGGHGH